MAHIPYTYTPIKKQGSKSLAYTPAPGGVYLSETAAKIPEGKCSAMFNFDVLSDRIASRKAQKMLFSSFSPEGEFHGINKVPFCGKTFIHIGNSLYAYESAGTEPALLSSALPDKNSLFCEFMSKLYIYCDTYVFSVNNLFEFAQEEPYAPVMYENITATGGITHERLSVPYNILAPRITASYKASEVKRFALPLKADVSRDVRVYEGDTEVDPSICTLEEDWVTINRSGTVDSRVVKISYYVKNREDIEFDSFITNCRIATSFGGDMNGGTRMFFTGNENDKGKYYKSELLNPLFVPSDEFEIIGNGSENITSLTKMYGDLIVFTVRSVYRMGYKLSDDGAFFSVKEISSAVGCDCPGSVQLIDNRVVFLNSEKGVFIVDSTENTGEQNIKPIGKNILKGNGCGLLDNSKESLAVSDSLDYDRRYMLFVGDRAYIWDYDESGFTDYGNYSRSQERLIWYLYDGIMGDVFFEAADGITSVTKERTALYGFGGEDAEIDVSCRYVSGTVEGLAPFVKKFVTDVSMIIHTQKNSRFSLSLFADGKKYYEIDLPEPSSGKKKIKLKLPKKALYGFGFEINGTGYVEIEQMLFDFTVIND